MKSSASVCDENSNSIQILWSHAQSIEAFSIRIYDIMAENENKIDEGEGEGEGRVIDCLNGTIFWRSYTQSLSVRSWPYSTVLSSPV